MGPSIGLADSFTQLVAHALAHVPLTQPGNLHDPRYVDWARARVGVSEHLEHDAALLARCWSADRSLDLLHGFCELHGSIADFVRTTDRPLGELDPEDVRDSRLLEAVRDLPVAELLHVTLALLAHDFARVLGSLEPELLRARDHLRPIVARLRFIPGLERARIELVWALGVHGRALEDRILIGAPAPWNGCSPWRQAVLAAHEHLVGQARSQDYFESEWVALTKLAAQLGALDDDELCEAHAQWLASLELSGLLAELVRRGRLTAANAEAIEASAMGRAAMLADLCAPC